MKRALAIAAAAVMIALAIVIRSAIDGDDSSSSTGTGTATGTATGTVACITELADACKALTGVAVRVEDASITAKAIAAGTANIDAWVTLDPWPGIVNQLAKREVTGAANRLARTDLLIAMVGERAARLAPACGGAVNWRCLGDAIGRPWTDLGGEPEWGSVKAGVPATTTAEGLILLGHASSGYYGTENFATNDFDDAFLVWKAKVTSSPATFTTFIQQFPAAFSGVGANKVDVTAGSGTRPVASIDPTPAADAVVVIAPVAGHKIPGGTNSLKDRLREDGWSTDRLSDPSGLPNAGVLLALSGLTG